jgi:hypothetical protein
MATHLVTPNAEQSRIIKFLVKKKMKSTEILRMLNAQYEDTLSCASVYDWYNNFSEGRKELSIGNIMDKCILVFKISDSC